jgi:cytochrome c oxidase assembly factor 2
MTTSLFTTTLAVSFIVVAAPHLLPCPVDPRAMADSADPEGFSSRKRRRRRVVREKGEETCNGVMSEERTRRKTESEMWKVPKRECPVPKPGGLIGQVLGVKKDGEDEVGVMREVERLRKEEPSK